MKTLIMIFALYFLSGCVANSNNTPISELPEGNAFERIMLRGGGLDSKRSTDRPQIETIRKQIESGKLTDEQIERLKRRNPNAAAEFEDSRHYPDWLKQTCLGYGFKPDTAPYSECLMQVDQAERQRRATMLKQPSVTNCSSDNIGGFRCTTN